MDVVSKGSIRQVEDEVTGKLGVSTGVKVQDLATVAVQLETDIQLVAHILELIM